MVSLGICFGTRPEYLKLEPLWKECARMKIPCSVYYVHQHESLEETLPEWIIHVPLEPIKGNRLNGLGSAILKGLEETVKEVHTHWIVQGDTSTALFSALYAFHRGIPVVHVEAGLRTYDRMQPFPEEVNRQMISRIATYHFTPHEECSEYLRQEKVQGMIHCVGNTILDTLVDLPQVNPENQILITYHRRENWTKLPFLLDQIEAFLKMDPTVKVRWSLHPNPNLQDQVRERLGREPRVCLESPSSHAQFLESLQSAKWVVTDSGGVQEEASFLGKQCIVLRESTERSHIPYPYVQLCPDFQSLYSMMEKMEVRELWPCTVYGDGTASRKILSVLSPESYKC